MILVDSTVWIDLLRKLDTVPVRHLRKLLDLGEATVAPVIVQEVLQGSVNPAAFEKLQRYFAAMPMSGADDAVELMRGNEVFLGEGDWHDPGRPDLLEPLRQHLPVGRWTLQPRLFQEAVVPPHIGVAIGKPRRRINVAVAGDRSNGVGV